MEPAKARCLVLGCGNTLRSDDGVGLWLCAWAAERFAEEPGVVILARQQWTPDLAEWIAHADSVLFLDCSIELEPGAVSLTEVTPSAPHAGIATHHTGAAELLALAMELYGSSPREALFLTVGAGNIELGETFSLPVKAALPDARDRIELAVRKLLQEFR